MNRNLKALGLALVAAFAMSAVVASAASAQQAFFTADGYPAVVKGEQEKTHVEGANYFAITTTTEERRFECTNAVYESTLATEASTELTVTPHIAGCKGSGVNATVDLNGCDFRFTAGTYTPGTTNTLTHGTADVICPKGSSIRFTIATCTIHIPGSGDGQNQNLTGVTFEHINSTTVTVKVDITHQIHYTHTDGFLCPFAGGGTLTDGSFVSNVTVHGREDLGEEPHATTSGKVTYKIGGLTPIDVK